MYGSRQQIGTLVLVLLMLLAFGVGRFSIEPSDAFESSVKGLNAKSRGLSSFLLSPEMSRNEFELSLPQTVSLPTGMRNNSWVLLEGIFLDSFIITATNDLQEILLRFTANYAERALLQDDYVEGSWGNQQSIPTFPFRPRRAFSLRLVAHGSRLMIFVDKTLVAKWQPRRKYQEVSTITITSMKDDKEGRSIEILSIKKGGMPSQRDPMAEALPRVQTMQGHKASPIDPTHHSLMFIAIVSSPLNFVARDAIRNSWLKDRRILDGTVQARFFIGQSTPEQRTGDDLLKAEIEKFNDVVVLDYLESDENSGNRTIDIVRFVTSSVLADYMMRCDDDSFVHLGRLTETLFYGQYGVYMGMMLSDVQVSRDPQNRWYVPMREYRRDIFPIFAQSNYVLSMDLVKFISSSSLPSCRLEDVSVGLWVEIAQQQGHMVQITKESRFYSGGCHLDSLLGHYILPSQMKCMWRKLEAKESFWCC